MTVDDYLPYHVNSLPLTNNSTIENYQSISRRIIRLTGELKLSQVTDSTLKAFAANMKGMGYAEATTHTTVKFYMRALKQAQKEGYIHHGVDLDFIYNKKEHPRIYAKLRTPNRCSFSLCQFGFCEIKYAIVTNLHDVYVMGFDVFVPVIKDN